MENSGSSCITCNHGRERPIFKAIRSGDVEKIKSLIKKGAKLDVRTRSNSNLGELDIAVRFVEDEELRRSIVNLLLDNGAKVNRRDELGNTVLLTAIFKKDPELVRLLIDRGATVNMINEKEFSPLHAAVLNDAYEIVKILLDKDAKADHKSGISIISLAAQNGLENMVKLLLCCGVYVSLSTLKLLIHFFSLSIAKLLVNYTDIKQIEFEVKKESKEWLLLRIAIESLQYETIEYLLDNMNVDINVHHRFADAQLKLPLSVVLSEESSAEDNNKEYKFKMSVKVLVRQIAILSTRNSFVCKGNIDMIETSEWMLDYYHSCRAELERMKVTKVCEDFAVTYFDVITKRSNALVNCLRLQNVVHVLQSDSYEKMFPFCCDKVKSKFNSGLERLQKMIKFEEVLRDTVGSVLQNDLILRMISEYYNYRDFAFCVEEFF